MSCCADRNRVANGVSFTEWHNFKFLFIDPYEKYNFNIRFTSYGYFFGAVPAPMG